MMEVLPTLWSPRKTSLYLASGAELLPPPLVLEVGAAEEGSCFCAFVIVVVAAASPFVVAGVAEDEDMLQKSPKRALPPLAAELP